MHSIDWYAKAGLNATDLEILKILPSNYQKAIEGIQK